MFKIFIHSLPRKCTSHILKAYFSQFTDKLKVKRSKNKGKRSKMYAILEVNSSEIYHMIMNNQHSLMGEKLHLRPFQSHWMGKKERNDTNTHCEPTINFGDIKQKINLVVKKELKVSGNENGGDELLNLLGVQHQRRPDLSQINTKWSTATSSLMKVNSIEEFKIVKPKIVERGNKLKNVNNINHHFPSFSRELVQFKKQQQPAIGCDSLYHMRNQTGMTPRSIQNQKLIEVNQRLGCRPRSTLIECSFSDSTLPTLSCVLETCKAIKALREDKRTGFYHQFGYRLNPAQNKTFMN